MDGAEGCHALVDDALDVGLDRGGGLDEDGLVVSARLCLFEFRFDGLEAREIEVDQRKAGDNFVGEGVDGCAADP